jgi:hypothetical protein
MLAVRQREILVLRLAEEARHLAQCIEGSDFLLPGDVARLLRRQQVFQEEDALARDFYLHATKSTVRELAA